MHSGMIYNIQRMSTQDGPGMRTTVFLKGCPLSCLWCSNPESQALRPQLLVFSNLCIGCGRCLEACPHGAVTREEDGFNRDLAICTNCGTCAEVCPSKARVMSGKAMDVDEVMKVVRKDALFYANSDGGVTFGGGEPTSGGDFLVEMLEASRKEGFHTCLDTCGHCAPEQFKRALDKSELLLFDCKHMDPEQHKKLTGVDNALILQNLRATLSSGVPVRIRIPLMPGLNDSEENIAALAAFLGEYGKDEVDVLPCHAFGRSKYDALRLPAPVMRAYEPEALEEALGRFKRHGLKVNIVK